MGLPHELPAATRTLVDVLYTRAALHPERSYLRFLESGDLHGPVTTRSFGELAARARAIGARLHDEGLRGQRALLLYAPGADYIDAFLGCLVAGVIPVPAYPPDPARLERTLPRLLAVVEDSGATAALSTQPIAGIAAAVGGPVLAGLDWITTDTVGDELGWGVDLPPPQPRDVAFVQYTSGSTGDPRGVVLTHACLLANQQVIFEGSGGRGPSNGWLPPYHDMGLIGLILQPLYGGYETILMSPVAFLREPVRWLRSISAFGAAQSAAPEFAFALLLARLREEDLEGLDLSRWEQVWNGAEPIRAETVEAFEDRLAPCGLRPGAIRPCYGLAEGTLMSTRLPPSERPVLEVDPRQLDAGRLAAGQGRRLVCVGTAAAGHELRVVDPDTCEPVEDGVIGEVWLRGPSNAAGYWRRPEQSEVTFGASLADGEGAWLRTGDLGAIGPTGGLYITGRKKDLILIRGRNIYPQDIEVTAAAAHRRVRAGSLAAFEVQADSGAAVGIVAEVDERDPPADLDAVMDAIIDAVSRGHDLNLGAVILLPYGRLPKTTSGKVRRQPTARAWLAGQLPVVAQRLAPGLQGPIYADLEAIAKRADRRSTAYQFDLDADIAWDRGAEPGVYVTSAMATALGIDLPAAELVGAHDTLQWAMAMAISRSFEALEVALLQFLDEEAAFVGERRSLDLLDEEERKHIQLFQRVEEHLVRGRPELLPVFERHADAIQAAVDHNMDRSRFGSRAEFHYRFWINLLFFEDWTIWLQDVLNTEADAVQPLWLSAHLAHAREEVQHTVTDRVFLDALQADEATKRGWARASLVDIATPNAAVGQVVTRMCQELHPGFSAWQRSEDPRLFHLLGERGFRRVRKQVPLFDDIARTLERDDTSVLADKPDAPDLIEDASLRGFLRASLTRLTGHPVGPAHDAMPFSRLGLDSATRISLAGELERHLGCAVSTTIAYEHPSVDTMVGALIAATGRPEPAPQVSVPEDLASSRQARLVRLHLSQPGGVPDHLVIGGELAGEVDEDALAFALSALVRRHASLRTRFVEHDDGSVRTRISEDVGITLRHLEAEDARGAAIRLARRLASRPFDLTRGPLLRAALVRDERSAYLLLVLHHSIGDSWSLDVLLRDWLALYRARRGDHEADLASLTRTAVELAQAEARLLGSPEGARRRAWWRQHLDGHAALAAEPPALHFEGADGSRFIGAERLGRLRAWAEAHDESLAAVILGAVHLHLHRSEGLVDALVGTQQHRRATSDLHDLVDYRVDVLPLRTDLHALTDLEDAVRRTRASWVQALAHSLPIAHLVEHLAPDHTAARSLLAPIAVNWIPFDYRADDEGFRYDPSLVPPPDFLFFERMLLAQPRGDGLSLHLWFDRESMSQDRAEAMLDGVLASLPD